MAVQLTKIPMAKLPISSYKAASRGLVYQARSSGNVISFERGKNIAFKASLDKAQISQKFWDDLLEKLRKAGGGGGGGSFDRIKVSMQLMDFISNKMIKALLENMKMGGPLPENISTNLEKGNITSMLQSVIPQNLKVVILPLLISVGLQMKNLSLLTSKMFSNLLNNASNLLGAFSLQMNKLKETLDKKLKKIFRKIEAALLDFFVEMKEEVKNFGIMMLKYILQRGKHL